MMKKNVRTLLLTVTLTAAALALGGCGSKPTEPAPAATTAAGTTTVDNQATKPASGNKSAADYKIVLIDHHLHFLFFLCI